ncbi:MAG: hypothetical protein ACHQRK_06870, partial [Gemmatimonadales bacterium]
GRCRGVGRGGGAPPPATGASALRRLRALAAERSPPDGRAARRAFLDALRERVPSLADAPLRAPLGRSLRRAGVTDATADAAEALLERLDAAAFSTSGVLAPNLLSRAVELAEAVNREAVRPGPGGAAIRTVGLVLLGAAALRLVAMPTGITRAFASGVSAYDHADFATAQRLFGRVAARAPRAADAWANLGAAAWSRGDTAFASLGWQRALRVDPLDDESRERLAAVQPSGIGSPAVVAPGPVDAAAAAGLALWLLAWLVLAVPAARRPSFARSAAGGALAVAVVAIGAALELESRSGVRGLGAVRTATSLLESPAASGSPVAAVSAGEVGALGAREGEWVRVTIDRARAGWLPTADLLRLDEPEP